MKNKLIVLSSWTEPMEKTWSGTTWSMTQALSKYYDVEIRDLKIPNWLDWVERFSRIPLIGVWFGCFFDWYSKRLANKVVGENKCIPVFEICTDVELRNPYFTYQDMTYIAGQYVKELKVEHSFIWGAAGNDVYGQTEINRRIRRQEKMYKNACGILWMGEWLHDYMTSQYPALSSKMYYIGGGTNLDPSKINDSQKSGNKFLFVGRDYERKGGDLVLSAFNILREKYMPSAELHIAGPENMDFNDDGVYYYGDADREKVSDLMNKCDVFCMPSRFEAYGLVFVESLIYGLPNVARDFFEMPHFIKDGKDGYLITDDNPTEYADLMYKAISNHDLINSVQSHREEYINKYSWDSVALRAKKIIDSKMGFE